jgi:hypothetical protein
MIRAKTKARSAALIVLAALACYPGTPTAAEEEPTISGAITGYYYAIPHEADYGVGVASLNSGALHLEARYNYEAKRSTSLFAGWNFAGGDGVKFQVTPILGGLFGETHGVVPGIEAGVAYREVDAYIEAEYVRDLDHSDASYYYAWSEIGWKPVQWLRIGLVGQRSREVQNGRDLQRGAFVQFVFDKITLGFYGFNPDSDSRYLIVSLGAQF